MAPSDVTVALAALLLSAEGPEARAPGAAPADLGAVRVAVEEGLANALARVLPEVMRRAARPPYLTRAEVCEMTGWSPRKVDYLRSERKLPFIRRGRTVLFATAEVEAYLDAGRVPARP